MDSWIYNEKDLVVYNLKYMQSIFIIPQRNCINALFADGSTRTIYQGTSTEDTSEYFNLISKKLNLINNEIIETEVANKMTPELEQILSDLKKKINDEKNIFRNYNFNDYEGISTKELLTQWKNMTDELLDKPLMIKKNDICYRLVDFNIDENLIRLRFIPADDIKDFDIDVIID